MTVDKAEVKAYLVHYASDFYDPAKAHEYYLKNRELKGRQPVAGETKDQRKARVATNRNQLEARMYADKQIRDKKHSESTGLTAEHKARMEKLRTNAEASRKRIEEKLNKLLESLKTQQKTPLNEIPTNATPKVRKYLEEQNARIAKSNALITDKAASEAKVAARAEMKKVGTELKAAVAAARTNYAKAKVDMTTKYKIASDKEHKNIAANVK